MSRDREVNSVLLIFTFFLIFYSPVQSGCKKNILETKLSHKDRNTIVKVHNALRLLVAKGQVPKQPTGINLKRLKWDVHLAKAAQNISNTCKFKHVKVKDGRWPVGQNLYKMSSTAHIKGINVTHAIHSWFNEHLIYKYPKYTTATGHYTQVVWATTKYVGCGYTYYKVKGKFKYQKLLVCNYGPAGNIKGMPPYKTGPLKKNKCMNLCK